MSQTDVLVVGAGPVGLVLAAELARRGLQPRIIDQSVGPSTTSKAIAIQPRTLEIFRNMGIVDEVLARGYIVGAGNVYLNGRPLRRIEFRDLDSPYRFIVDLPQNETEEVLLEHLARNGLAVERDTRLLRLEQDEDGVNVDLVRPSGSESSRYAFVVGCDGAYSTVRHFLGLEVDSSPVFEQVVLADMRIDWLFPHELHLFLHTDGFLGCFPLPGGRYRLIAEVTAEEERESVGKPGRPPRATPERFREIVRRRADADARLGDPTWLAGFQIQHQAAREYAKGRVFIAGDAAHVPSPAGGQGMNTGIQDACNLAWKMNLAVRGRASHGLLASYTAERSPVGRSMVALSDRLAHAALANGSTSRGGGPIATESSLVNQISEIGIHYRDSPIVAQDWNGTGGPQPGDRAPVMEGLDGTAHHMLLFAGEQPDLEALARVSARAPEGFVYPRLVTTRSVEWNGPVIADENRALHRRFGAESACVYILRPDGYVGYRASPADPDLFSAYLARVFR